MPKLPDAELTGSASTDQHHKRSLPASAELGQDRTPSAPYLQKVMDTL